MSASLSPSSLNYATPLRSRPRSLAVAIGLLCLLLAFYDLYSQWEWARDEWRIWNGFQDARSYLSVSISRPLFWLGLGPTLVALLLLAASILCLARRRAARWLLRSWCILFPLVEVATACTYYALLEPAERSILQDPRCALLILVWFLEVALQVGLGMALAFSRHLSAELQGGSFPPSAASRAVAILGFACGLFYIFLYAVWFADLCLFVLPNSSIDLVILFLATPILGLPFAAVLFVASMRHLRAHSAVVVLWCWAILWLLAQANSAGIFYLLVRPILLTFQQVLSPFKAEVRPIFHSFTPASCIEHSSLSVVLNIALPILVLIYIRQTKLLTGPSSDRPPV